MPNSQNYDQNLKIVASFDSVQSFWDVYSHLVRPNDLTGHCDLHVFKSGIKPLWEVSNYTGIPILDPLITTNSISILG